MGKKSKKPSKQAPKPKAPPAVPPAEAVPRESAQIYSAHKTISVYQGTEDGVATFGVATYLRYAKADASKAEEPRHDLSLPLAAADAHTALLSESAEGAISSVVASLSIGDRVELEWLQIKIEMDTDIEEHKFGMVEQCQKLLKLDAATEEALVKQYPQPELLLPKVAPKAKGEEKAALEAKFGKKKKRKGKKGRA